MVEMEGWHGRMPSQKMRYILTLEVMLVVGHWKRPFKLQICWKPTPRPTQWSLPCSMPRTLGPTSKQLFSSINTKSTSLKKLVGGWLHTKIWFNRFSGLTGTKSTVVFLFGDYEFLCKLFGIAGASGKFLYTQYTLEWSLWKQSVSECFTLSLVYTYFFQVNTHVSGAL